MDAFGKESSPTGRHSRPLLLLGAGLLLATLYALALTELHRLERVFESTAREVVRTIDLKARTFEICLAGFANLAASMPQIDYEQLRLFARSLRMSYPDLYMLELAERVEEQERAGFERRMRRVTGLPHWAIHRFGYDSDRKIHPAPGARDYMPVTFIEPYSEAVRPVLGLDLNSTSATLRAALQAIRDERQRSSGLFELAEGGSGYLLYQPVRMSLDEGRPRADVIAIAVIRVADLIPEWIKSSSRWQINLVRAGESEAQLLRWPESLPEKPAYERWLPQFELAGSVRSEAQPLRLVLRFQPGLADLDTQFIAISAVLVLVIMLILVRWLRFYQMQEKVTQQVVQELANRANFDQLTGLPNTNLLMDRLEQALARARRTGSRVGICYLDFDQFKPVNDSLGHDAGDELLRQGAARIQSCLRAEDSVARIHGDEFIVLLPSVSSADDLQLVATKLNAGFREPFRIKGRPLRIGISCGTALYPDDGTNAESLIAAADLHMYRVKKSRKERAAAV